MNIAFILLIIVLALFAVFRLPRFIRTVYFSWFDVEKFRQMEVERVTKLWSNRPKSLSDNTEQWVERVQTPGWLWFNRLVVTMTVVVVVGLIVIIGLGFVGVGPVRFQ